MSEMLPTFGGQVTRAEVFTKMLFHLREAQSLAATMAHLHNLQDNQRDALRAQGWLAIEQMLNLTCHNITQLAKGSLN